MQQNNRGDSSELLRQTREGEWPTSLNQLAKVEGPNKLRGYSLLYAKSLLAFCST
jgi:hypothetical protein